MKKKYFPMAIIASLALAAGIVLAEKNANNLKIAGAGSVSGGDFDKIEISGSGNIDGDVRAVEIHVSGSADFKGNIQAKKVEAGGSLKIQGLLDADTVESSGSLKVTGKLLTRELHSSGSASFETLEADTVTSSGSISALKDIKANYFGSTGKFEIGGTLNADKIEVKLAGDSSAKLVKGKAIEVRQYSSLISKVVKSFLTADKIQGDELYLENVNAKLVKGKTVKIGPRCNIDVVEYKDTVSVDPQSRVGKQNKVLF